MTGFRAEVTRKASGKWVGNYSLENPGKNDAICDTTGDCASLDEALVRLNVIIAALRWRVAERDGRLSAPVPETALNAASEAGSQAFALGSDIGKNPFVAVQPDLAWAWEVGFREAEFMTAEGGK
ncbi:MAG TPA: hypothetical protein VFC21_12940 [Bryobacteraceae bacterium]|nr:hypothetical protein [Bryobacteraceae bacterium]